MGNNTAVQAIDYKHYFEKAINYYNYKENFQQEIEEGDLSPYFQYLPQNWRRQSRLDRKLNLRPELLRAVRQIDEVQHWLVITEHWCGDASQINPIIAKVASLNNKISLRFIYRDENPELIDAHLTDGRSRSIPILLILDKDYKVVNVYGPRPEEAQKLVQSLLAKGESYGIPLHTWYAKDKQQSIQQDFVQLISAVNR